MCAKLAAVNPEAARKWGAARATRPVRILVVQRDNIGDLVLATPFVRALRAALPDATIDAFVSSYTAAVLERNPDLNNVFSYVKGKHRAPGQPLVSLWGRMIGLVLDLRRRRYDLAVLPGLFYSPTTIRFARATRPACIAGFVPSRAEPDDRVALPVFIDDFSDEHVIARRKVLLDAILGRAAAPTDPEPPPCAIYPDAARVAAMKARVRSKLGNFSRLVGIHISARRPAQRWPEDRWVEFLHQYLRAGDAAILMWSPGAEDDPRHPGDDAKAARILERCSDLPIVPCETPELPDLIAAMSLVDFLVCSDGGAMHVAAALGKPMVCFFGRSSPEHWRPWKARHAVLRPDSQEVADVTVAQVLDAAASIAEEPAR